MGLSVRVLGKSAVITEAGRPMESLLNNERVVMG